MFRGGGGAAGALAGVDPLVGVVVLLAIVMVGWWLFTR
jgi:hypothetical protein